MMHWLSIYIYVYHWAWKQAPAPLPITLLHNFTSSPTAKLFRDTMHAQLLLLLGTLYACFYGFAVAQGPSYSPVRPPALPLAVRSPYVNAWSSTANGGTLNSQAPVFYSSSSTLFNWEGIVVVDEVAYEYLGDATHELPAQANFIKAEATAVNFDSQYSNFSFVAGPVTIEASFFSPVTPKDVCRTSIPLSYLTTSVRPNDGRPHRIRFYSDVGSAWLGVYEENQVSWALHNMSAAANGTITAKSRNIFNWIFSHTNPFIFGESGDLPLWGNFTYNTSPARSNFSFSSGESTAVRQSFVQDLALNNDVTKFITAFGDHTPVFAFAHDFGIVNQTSVRYTLGSIQDPIVQYITDDGLTKLTPWWSKCYGDIYSMIGFHWDDYATVQQMGHQFENQLQADINAFYEHKLPAVYNDNTAHPAPLLTDGTDQFGEKFIFDSSTDYGFLDPANWTGVAVPFVSEAQSYYSIVALSARQVMGAYVYAQNPNQSRIDPLVFQKELSSDGNINTVDVMYPATPFFLYANPDLLKYVLEPLFEYQEGRFYPNGYCAHDLGTYYPNATGHLDGEDEYMPVEESANFILMSYGYYKFTGDASWLTSHYELLRQFAQYLIEFTLIPGQQVSTDDFAGALTNQTNLAIKGIVGLQAMSSIARLSDNMADAIVFSNTATSYYNQWEYLGLDSSGRHATLAYQWRSSWGLLYNIYFDKLLNMGLVNESLYSAQSDWYSEVSQAYGVPLDNRHSYTKSDWQLWAAATSEERTRRLFVNSIAFWLNQTASDGPFTDLYECVSDGDYPEGFRFSARPVVGGHYSFLALGKTGQTASSEGGNSAGSLFARNSTQALSSPAPSASPHQIVQAKSRRKVTTVLTSG
ncbi:DUF1793-domain-containing protein [Xylariaceae sp. FL0255]|nr:DUF1793-domain-containing protein [Xylariaceae sp. FL0255]